MRQETGEDVQDVRFFKGYGFGSGYIKFLNVLVPVNTGCQIFIEKQYEADFHYRLDYLIIPRKQKLL